MQLDALSNVLVSMLESIVLVSILESIFPISMLESIVLVSMMDSIVPISMLKSIASSHLVLRFLKSTGHAEETCRGGPNVI